MKIKEAKPVKVGNSFYFTIPKQYITNGEINPEKRYNVDIQGPEVDLSPETIKEVTDNQISNITRESNVKK